MPQETTVDVFSLLALEGLTAAIERFEHGFGKDCRAQALAIVIMSYGTMEQFGEAVARALEIKRRADELAPL